MAYAPANAAATIATSSRMRSAVKTWWCLLNIGRGSTGKGLEAQANGHPLPGHAFPIRLPRSGRQFQVDDVVPAHCLDLQPAADGRRVEQAVHLVHVANRL